MWPALRPLAQDRPEFRLRMRVARKLLTTTNLPVAVIAERVGYQSDLSFVKAFKKLHEMTPRTYRNKN